MGHWVPSHFEIFTFKTVSSIELDFRRRKAEDRTFVFRTSCIEVSQEEPGRNVWMI